VAAAGGGTAADVDSKTLQSVVIKRPETKPRLLAGAGGAGVCGRQ